MKTTLIAFGIVFALIAGLVVFSQQRSAGTPSVATSTVTQTASSTPASAYSLATVRSHASGADCWTIVNGKVYDATAWINRHPGGSRAILSMCGVDASASFDGQHGGQARPASELAGFEIGTLAR